MGGSAWQPIFDDQPIQNIGALAIQQDNPNVVWATIATILRKDKVNKKGLVLIHFRITRHRKSRYISSSIYIEGYRSKVTGVGYQVRRKYQIIN